MKRYLKTPEEVMQALKEGKTVKNEYGYTYELIKDAFIVQTFKEKIRSINTTIFFDEDYYIDEPEQLKLEVGKFYKTRERKKAWVVSYKQGLRYPYSVAVLGEVGTYTVLGNGCCYENHTTPQDIVALWEE